jgi:hypothetical protein
MSQMAQSLSQPRKVQGIGSMPAPKSIRGNVVDLFPNEPAQTAPAQSLKAAESLEEGQRLHPGDPIVVTAPNEFEGKTGEIYDFSPSGSFVIVDLYNHGKHSMHLSDIEYNDYADQEEADDWYDESMDEDAAMPPQDVSPPAIIAPAPSAKYMVKKPQAPQAQADEPAPRHPKVNPYDDDASTLTVYKPEQYREAKADPTGSWVVYNGGKVVKFKTHTGAKAYAAKNGGKVASSEFYADKIQKQGVAETALNPKDPQGDYAAKRKALQDLGMNKAVDQAAVLQRRLDLDREAKAKGVTEVAPPGAKAERMVKGIKKSLSKDGHLSDKDKAIAYATTWKAHNAGKVEESPTDYQKRRQRERDVDAGRPVKPLPKNPQTDYAKKRAKDRKDMEMGEGLGDYERREFKRQELQHELGHERNNIAIAINGKTWKVVPGKGYADSAEERAYLNGMRRWAEKKSAATGKKWTVHLTGANPTVNELSTEKLAQYKTAAALDAGAADKAGNYERGDKRFSGIVRATKKQFANDLKKHKDQGVTEATPRHFGPKGAGTELARQIRAELANMQQGKGTPVPAKEFAKGIEKDLQKAIELYRQDNKTDKVNELEIAIANLNLDL